MTLITEIEEDVTFKYSTSDEQFMFEFNEYLEDKGINTSDWDVEDYLEDYILYLYEMRIEERINEKVSERLWF